MLKNKSSIHIFILVSSIWWILGSITIAITDQIELFQYQNQWHNSTLDTIMPYITQFGEGYTIIPIILILIYIYRLPFFKTLLFYGMIVGIPPLVTQIMKNIVQSPRPLKMLSDHNWVHVVEGYTNNFNNSWPSGHTTGAFSIFFLLSYTLQDRYKYWSIFFVLCGLLVGFSRIYLSQHFFEDIVAGSIVGTVVPYFIIYYFKDKKGIF